VKPLLLVSDVGRLTGALTVHWPSAVAGSGVNVSVCEVVAVTEAVTPPEVDAVPLLSVQLTVHLLIAMSSVPLALKVTDIELGAGIVLVFAKVQA
jgi:hypothetical protein